MGETTFTFALDNPFTIPHSPSLLIHTADPAGLADQWIFTVRL